MHKVMKETLSELQELANKTGETLGAGMWRAIDRTLVPREGGRAYLYDLNRAFRGYAHGMDYATFRDAFVALCGMIGLRIEKQGKKVFVLKP
jgi:hypothetical protein